MAETRPWMHRRTGLPMRMPGVTEAVWSFAFALLLSLPLLMRLGAAPLFDVDEGAFSEATREMLVSKDFGHTTLNGEPRFDKPPGVYWLQAASVSLLGWNETALRLPSALCTWLQALLLMRFATQQWGQQVGRLAGLMTVTALGPLLIGRAATADALLNLLITAAALDAWRYLAHDSLTAWRRAALWVGLGWLVKGPVALLVPGAAVLLWAATSRNGGPLRRGMTDAPAWLLMAIALPWYLYALDRHGAAFVEGFLWRHNLQRFGGTLEGHAGGPLYYAIVLPLLALPWTPLLVPVLRQVRSSWKLPVLRYLLCWAGFVLLFFSLSGTKLPHYVLYGFSPLVLLMAQQAAGLSPRGRGGLCLAMAGCTVAIMLATGLSQAMALEWIAHPMYRALLAGAELPYSVYVSALIVVTVCVLAVRWARTQELSLPVCAMAVALFVSAVAQPWWAEALQGPVKRAAAQVPQGASAVQWSLHLPSFAVYLEREAPRRAPRPGEYALTRADHAQAALAEPDLKPVWSERGLVLLLREARP